MAKQNVSATTGREITSDYKKKKNKPKQQPKVKKENVSATTGKPITQQKSNKPNTSTANKQQPKPKAQNVSYTTGREIKPAQKSNAPVKTNRNKRPVQNVSPFTGREMATVNQRKAREKSQKAYNAAASRPKRENPGNIVNRIAKNRSMAYMSDYDKQNLSPEQYEWLKNQKNLVARGSGDINLLHAAAEMMRLNAGYSGGKYGNEMLDPSQTDLSNASDLNKYLKDGRTGGLEDMSRYQNISSITGKAIGKEEKTAIGYMTDVEKQTYNYIRENQGEKKAREYLSYIQQDLNIRKGVADAEEQMGRTGVQKALGAAEMAIEGGLSQNVSGLKQIPGMLSGNNRAVAMSPEEIASAYYKEKGIKSNTARDAYEVVEMLSNMAPALAIGAVTGGTGSIAAKVLGEIGTNGYIGATAAGNTYTQEILNGRDPEQARIFALSIGTVEALGSKMLGGFKPLRSLAMNKVFSKRIAAVSNGFAKAILETGKSMISEGLEEGIQEAVAPMISSIVYDEKYTPAELSDIAHSALLGALSAGVIEGPANAINAIAERKAQNEPSEPLGLPAPEQLGLPTPAETAQNGADNLVNLAGQMAGLGLNEEPENDLYTNNTYVNENPNPAPRTEPTRPTQAEQVATLFGDESATDSPGVYERQEQERPVQQQQRTAPMQNQRFNIADESNPIDVMSAHVGAEGAKVMRSMYDGNVNDISGKTMYAKAMTVAWNAGYNSQSLEDVRIRGANREQIQAAYNAGRMDSMNAVERQQDAASIATAYSKHDAGLVINEATESIPENLRKSIDKVAKVMGVKIVVADNVAGLNDSGMSNVNGFYMKSAGAIVISRDKVENAKDPEAMLKFVFGHEVTHRMQNVAPKEYAQLRSIAMKLTPDSANKVNDIIQTYRNSNKELSAEEAMDEITADFVGRLINDDEALRRFVKSSEKSVVQRVIDAFKNIVNALTGKTKSDVERAIAALERLSAASAKNVRGLEKEKVAKTSGRRKEVTINEDGTYDISGLPNAWGIKNFFIDADNVVYDINGNAIAVDEGNSIVFSMGTLEEGHQAMDNLPAIEYMRKVSPSRGIDPKDSEKTIEEILRLKGFLEGLLESGEFEAFEEWTGLKPVVDENGNPVYDAIKENGEYHMNVELSTNCKKREPFDALFNELVKRNLIDRFVVDERAVVEINRLIADKGLEVACFVCFVDAKRFKQGKVADEFAKMFNKRVNGIIPKGSGLQANHFNFGGNEELEIVDGIHNLPDDQLNLQSLRDVMDKETKKKHDKLRKDGKPTVKADGSPVEPTTVDYKISKYLLNTPSARQLLTRGDMVTTKGFEAMTQMYPELRSIYNSKKGTGGPKVPESAQPYLHEILRSNKFFKGEKGSNRNIRRDEAYSVGGVRLQSFSDFIARMVFDYIEIFGDLSLLKMPGQAYTKEEMFVKIFGLTGIKINMSLIPKYVKGGIAPGLDANGNYVWHNGQSFDFDTAVDIQNDPKYGKNVGTIAIGISKRHILKMMADPNIRMIIPYHKSSLSQLVAKMNQVANYENYTKFQNTRYKSTGKKITKETAAKFDWYEHLHNNEARYERGEISDPMNETAQEYLDWCENENLIPVFDEYAYDEKGKMRPGYYKMLIDFAAYDADGNYSKQGDIQMNFPEIGDKYGSVEELMKTALAADTKSYKEIKQKTVELADEIAELFDKYENEDVGEHNLENPIFESWAKVYAPELLEKPKKKSTKKSSTTKKNTKKTKAAQTELNSDDVVLSVGEVDTDSPAFKNWFGDSKVVNEDGSPKVVYHQTNKDFTVFDNSNPVAAQNDGETPNGYFFKETDEDIGIGDVSLAEQRNGDKQMAVYLSIKNPLKFVNRAAAVRWYKQNIPEYNVVREQYEKMNARYQKQYDDIEAQESEVLKSDIDKDEKYRKYEELLNEEDKVLEDWGEDGRKLDRQLRDILTNYFVNNESQYDGIVLDFDGRRRGVNVKSYIAFKPNQVKSVNNTGAFDPNNNDIMFSVSTDDDFTRNGFSFSGKSWNLKKSNLSIKIGTEAKKALQTSSKAFKNWFKNSKVVNEDGSPKVMYHGTSNYGFNIFLHGEYGLFGNGSYFTDNKGVAREYSNARYGENRGVYEVYLSIQNPLDADAAANIEEWKKAFEDFDMDLSFFSHVKTNTDAIRCLEQAMRFEMYTSWEAAETLEDMIRSMGYDGITHIGGGRYNKKDPRRHRVYIAFDSNQIKSAANNVGTFDPNNDDIRFSLPDDDGMIYSPDKETQAKITEDYKKEVDKILSKKSQNDNSLLVGYTPKVFLELGVPALPLVIGRGHVYSVAKTKEEAIKEHRYNPKMNYHGLGETVVKNIYKAINKPIAIITSKDIDGDSSKRSESSVIALIDTGKKGKIRNVIPIKITTQRKLNGKLLHANSIETMYPIDVQTLLVNALIKEHNGETGIYYIKKEAANLTHGWVQFPTHIQAALASDGIVHLISDKVNLRVNKNTESLQFKRWFGNWENADSDSSVVVNENNSPKATYRMNLGRFSSDSVIWYTDSFEMIREMRKKDPSSMKKINRDYLNMRNPLIVDCQGNARDSIPVPNNIKGRNTFRQRVKNLDGTFKYVSRETTDIETLTRYAKNNKYDGIILENIKEDNFISTLYGIFDSAQAKSATSNVGTYNPNDEDTQFSIDDDQELLENREAEVRGNLDRMIDEYGAIEPGENPARDVKIPQSTDGEDRVSQTLRTVMEANVTPDSYIPTIEEMIESGEYSFKSFGDQEALSMAYNKIQKKGFPNALADWTKEVGKGRVSKELTAMGWVLYNNAVNSNDTATATRILSLMASHQREAARALQASRILKKLDPESQLHNIEADVEDIIDAVGKRAPDIEIPPELIDKFRKAKTDEERAEVEAEIIQDVARKIPSTLKDKWNNWRYLAMLFNLRTHIRNVVGNAGFAVAVAAKDIVATGVETAVYYAGGKDRGMQRTKSFYGKELFAAAWNDYNKMEAEVLGDAKYNDSREFSSRIEDARVIFPGLFGKPINFAMKLNSGMLEAEDSWFARPHYANALAQYCAANGISPDAIKSGVDITKEELDKARAYAIKEAQKATYRDLNQFSEWIQSLGRVRRDDGSVKKTVKILVDGILPFRKTPANILVRGLEYSPVGIAYGLRVLIKKVPKGEATVAECLDTMSAGMTGTALFGLGYLLAKLGILIATGDDDQDGDKFDKMIGHQDWSIEAGGKSITVDWLAPEVMPMFMGAETAKHFNENADNSISAWITGLSSITDPMLELSCLSGVNDMLNNIANFKNGNISSMTTVVSNMALSYFMQGIPTLSGQIERVTQPDRVMTFTDENGKIPPDIQYTIGKVANKVLGWDYHEIPYIDAWGQTTTENSLVKRILANMVNPAYTKDINSDKVNTEIRRLYGALNSSIVLPNRASKYYTYEDADGKTQKVYLTKEEYVAYAIEKGTKSLSLVSNFINSDTYKILNDKERGEVIGKLYDYANAKAAAKSIKDYKGSTPEWIGKYDALEDVDVTDYIIANQTDVVKNMAGSLVHIKDKNEYDTVKSNAIEMYKRGGVSQDDAEKKIVEGVQAELQTRGVFKKIHDTDSQEEYDKWYRYAYHQIWKAGGKLTTADREGLRAEGMTDEEIRKENSKKINSFLVGKIKDEGDGSEVFIPPKGRDAYKSYTDTLHSSEFYTNLSEKERKKIDNKALELASESGDSYKKNKAAVDAGVPPEQLLIFSAAVEAVDDGNGITQGEFAKAVQNGGISSSQAELVWTAWQMSWSKKDNKQKISYSEYVNSKTWQKYQEEHQ